MASLLVVCFMFWSCAKPQVKGDGEEPSMEQVQSDDAMSRLDKLAESGKLETIYFDYDSYRIKQESQEVLQDVANWLKAKGETYIQIEGHCDDRGSIEYNLALGEKRANAAKRYLVDLGVPAKNVSIISYGEEKPAMSGADESAWSKNRRDEFVILTK